MRKRIRFLLGIVLLSLVLSACSSDAGSAKGSSSDEEEETKEEKSSSKKKKKKKKDKDKEDDGNEDPEQIEVTVTDDDGGNRVFSVFLMQPDEETASGFGLFVNPYENPELNKALVKWSDSPDSEDCSVLVTRSDAHFMSFVKTYGEPEYYDPEEDFYDPGYSIFVGHNYHTDSGKEVLFKEIVTDTDLFEERLLDKIFTQFPDEGPIGEGIRETIGEGIENASGDKGTSCPEFSWVIGYEGLTVYMHPYINFNYSDSGTYDVEEFFIPYAGNEDMFTSELSAVPASYMYQVIPSEGFYGTIHMDPGHEGKDDDMFLNTVTQEESGSYTGIGGNGYQVSFDPVQRRPLVWYVRGEDGKASAMIQVFEDEGYRGRIFTGGLDHSGSYDAYQTIIYDNWYSEELGGYGKQIVFDPQEFYLRDFLSDDSDEEVDEDFNLPKLYRVGKEGTIELSESTHVQVNPVSAENIIAHEDQGYYTIKDNADGSKGYVIDADTKLAPFSGADIPGYEVGKDTMEWMDKYLNGDPSSGLAFGMGDIFDMVVYRDHVEKINAIYWWD
ncbi:MAG: hypothetical protein K5888_03985 [Lachnospiraceae bacterium]|nr:hypothetical protein [Lachnospiraceae bacterium]